MDHQKRFILAMVLSGIIVIAWQYLFPPPLPPEQPDAGAAVEKKVDGTTPAATADTKVVPVPVAQPAKVIPARKDVLTTPKFKVTLSNQGGVVTGVDLIDPAQYQKAGDLLGATPKENGRYPFAITFDKGALNLPADLTFEVVEASESKVLYRHVDPSGRFTLTRSYSAHPELPFTLNTAISITNHSQDASLNDRMVMTLQGYEDPDKETSFLEIRSDEIEAICHSEDDMERNLHSQLEKPETLSGPIVWSSVGSRYFFWSYIPERAAERCVMNRDGAYGRSLLTWSDFSIAPGSTYTYEGKVYAGPKDLDVLSKVQATLGESVDYGILTILAKPMRWLLNFFYGLVHNWGLAIILLTFLIKLVTWPFTEKSYANAERMKDIQPLLDDVRKRYENDQQRLAEETMKLFKEHSFNPLGGCLPMVLQMPILYGLYVMIINSVELYHAHFALWYTDLSSRDPYYILPVLMGIMMFVQQHFMTPPTSASTSPQQQQMQQMMKFMPIMFTAFMFFLPSGLVLYYSLNLVLGILQQWLIRRKFARRREAAAAAAAA